MGPTQRVAPILPDMLPHTSVRWQRSKHRPSFARIYVGDGCSLELLRMRVTVTIEGPRARTVVDHVFRNPHNKLLEGTFEYPLPASATPCYYAMFLTPQQEQDRVPAFFGDSAISEISPAVFAAMQPSQAMRKVDSKQWGTLREATVVPKEKGRQAYEEITRRQIDPALLEYSAGNTFRGRVFPIQASGLNRVVVAYEEHLDMADGRVSYRFPLPDCDLEVLDVTVTVDGHGVSAEEISAGKDRTKITRSVERESGRITYHRTWGNGDKKIKGPAGELALRMTPVNTHVQAITGMDPSAPAKSGKQARTFYARVRPELPTEASKPFADRGVFLLDTSYSEQPDRFRANLEILKQILESDTELQQFNVACFDVRAAWIKPDGWIRNDEQGRRMVFARLHRVMLEGATDLSAAFDLLKRTRWRPAGAERQNGYVFLMSDGQLNWGDRNIDMLVHSLADATLIQPRVFCYRTGISAENLELFRKLTRAGGGIFNVFTEAMAGRVGLAHRRPAFQLERVEVAGAKDLLVAGRQAAVFPGGEIVVAGRYTAGTNTPTGIVLRGRLDGRPKVVRLPLALGDVGTLADRAWAEIAVHQLLELNDPRLEPLAVAYAQRYHIGSRMTSFLVLERDTDYQRFDIQKEASQLKVADMAGFLEASHHRKSGVPTRREHWKSLLEKRQLAQGPAHQLLARMHEQDLRLPAGSVAARVMTWQDASRTYLEDRLTQQQRDGVDLFIREAEARARKRDEQGCVRALSTVVETHPGRCDAMRLVGYRLLSWNQFGPAARLFDQVRIERPFEPHSYRDLARSLELSFRYPFAALQYEIVLAGKWHDRFEGSLHEVAHAEYEHLIALALRSGSLSSDLIDWFSTRQAQLWNARNKRGQQLLGDDVDLRVTINWNTDNTDVDLWVVEPDGTACGYEHMETRNGGQLLADLRAGYGPERYQIKSAPRGKYAVIVHYFATNENLIAGETHVEVVVERRPGHKGAETRRFQVVLTKHGEAHEVCVVKFD